MTQAPPFIVKSTADEDISLPEHGVVVLYFYPRADTPGCTLEGKTFTELYPEFIKEGAMVWGISPDPLSAVCDFKEKYSFPFPLLADEDHAVAEKYGVWKPKKMFGKEFMGVKRKTFLIKDGEIVEEFSHKPGKTEQEVLEAVRGLTD